MINHVRTLLLNADPRSFPPTGNYCSQLIDPDFRPISPDGKLSDIRNVLFGSQPEPLGLNYRMHQYMTVLHAEHRLYDYFASIDPRITYKNDRQIFDFEFGLKQTSAGTNAGIFEVRLMGDLSTAIPENKSRLLVQVDLLILAEEIRVYDNVLNATAVVGDWDDLLTTPVELPAGNFGTVVIKLLQERDIDNEGNATYSFELTAPPARPMSEILQEILSLHSHQLWAMFNATPVDEFSETINNLVSKADSFQPQMAGVLAIVARYTEAKRAQRLA